MAQKNCIGTMQFDIFGLQISLRIGATDLIKFYKVSVQLKFQITQNILLDNAVKIM